jgi:hypothetical protein
MIVKTKYGPIDKLKVTYYFLGPRSAWDHVEIGPFKRRTEAESHLSYGSPKSCIRFKTVYGLEALKILEQFEKENK